MVAVHEPSSWTSPVPEEPDAEVAVDAEAEVEGDVDVEASESLEELEELEELEASAASEDSVGPAASAGPAGSADPASPMAHIRLVGFPEGSRQPVPETVRVEFGSATPV